MAYIINMPKWGSAMVLGKIVHWYKDEGEEVAAGEELVEIETEKISNIVEAPASGILAKVLVPVGEEALVGEPLAVITMPGEEWDGRLEASPDPKETAYPAAPAAQNIPNTLKEPGSQTDRRAATPAAKKLAQARGVNLAEVKVLGAGARITVKDVLEHLAAQTGWPGSHFTVVDENLIHYFDLGQGFPIVLLHGLGASATAWQPNLHYLAGHFRVLAPDFPGAGHSDNPEAAYDLLFHLKFLAGFLDELNIDRCILLGNSLGGAIALEFAHQHPEKVRGLVLENPAGLGQEVNPQLKPVLLQPNTKEAIHQLLTLLFYDDKFVFPGVVEEIFQYRRQPGAPAALERAVAGFLGDDGQKVSLRSKLSQLHQPALILWGEQDQITPLTQGQEAVKLIPDSRLIVYQECGHCPHIEKAPQFNEDVVSFSKKILS